MRSGVEQRKSRKIGERVQAARQNALIRHMYTCHLRQL